MKSLNLLLIFLLISLFNSCTSYDNSPIIYPEGWYATDATNAESLPCYYTLRLGDRLWIKNAGVIINFSAVYKESYNSYQVLIYYYYDNGFYEKFSFNSDELPETYELKTLARHITSLTDLRVSGDSWKLEMEYNEYAYL